MFAIRLTSFGSAIPPHVLGVTDEDDADFVAMLQFADSVIRLAELTRRSGHAVEAVNELWPLIARLEARVASGRSERDVTVLLTNARVAFGTSLGHILPGSACSPPRGGQAKRSAPPDEWGSLPCRLMFCGCTAMNSGRPDTPKRARPG
jgi:hypothetical protein